MSRFDQPIYSFVCALNCVVIIGKDEENDFEYAWNINNTRDMMHQYYAWEINPSAFPKKPMYEPAKKENELNVTLVHHGSFLIYGPYYSVILQLVLYYF